MFLNWVKKKTENGLNNVQVVHKEVISIDARIVALPDNPV